MNSAPMTPEQTAALALLANSPLAAEARDRHETGRAERRRIVLTKLQADEAPARAAAAAAGAAERAARDRVTDARRVLAAALAELARAEYLETVAAEAAERVRNRALAELRPLGNDAIEKALAGVLVALRGAQGSLDYREWRDSYGNVTAVTPRDEEAPRRIAKLQSTVAELEALRLSPAAPSEIEAQCAEARAWLDEPARVAPPRPARGRLARALGR